MSGFETIIYEKIENIGIITLNRPQSLNVYNVKMRDELFEVLEAVKYDDEVKVVIVRGAGDKAFCAGADLSEFLTAPPPIFARQVRFERDIWGLFLSIPQPLIAALHGYVLGSGIEIALLCDIRIASEDVKFGLPEVGLGIIPAAGGTQTLPRTIGIPKTLEMLLAGKWLNADEAYRFKMVNKIVARHELWSTAERIADKIKGHSSEAVIIAKKAVVLGLDLSLTNGLYLESRLSRLLDTQIVNPC
jgi:enoyl-CoA hydratase/carnithine racemase